jgi:hypothetical protein
LLTHIEDAECALRVPCIRCWVLGKLADEGSAQRLSPVAIAQTPSHLWFRARRGGAVVFPRGRSARRDSDNKRMSPAFAVTSTALRGRHGQALIKVWHTFIVRRVSAPAARYGGANRARPLCACARRNRLSTAGLRSRKRARKIRESRVLIATWSIWGGGHPNGPPLPEGEKSPVRIGSDSRAERPPRRPTSADDGA